MSKLTFLPISLVAMIPLAVGAVTPAGAEIASTTANFSLIGGNGSGIAVKSISLTPSAPTAGSAAVIVGGTISTGGTKLLGGGAPTQTISIVVPGSPTSVTTNAQLTQAECNGGVCEIKKITNDAAPAATPPPTVSPLPAVSVLQSNQPLSDVIVPATPPTPLKIESKNTTVLAPAKTTPVAESDVQSVSKLSMFTKKLDVGSRGSEVIVLQEFLIRNKFLKTSATGYFSNLTKTAVSNFQNIKKLKPTGRLDTATMNYLAKNVK